MCIHMHLFSLLYTYKCTYILVYIHAHRYISHLRTHTHTHTHIDVYHMCIYIYNLLYLFTCVLMFRQLKLTCRGMFHCTFSNNWAKLATLADNCARTKEHKAQRTKGAKKYQLPKGGYSWETSMELNGMIPQTMCSH